VRPVGIAIPRQGNTNPETYHRQSSIGKLHICEYLVTFSNFSCMLYPNNFFQFEF
jgi:hypothetical protein